MRRTFFPANKSTDLVLACSSSTVSHGQRVTLVHANWMGLVASGMKQVATAMMFNKLEDTTLC